MKIDIQIDRVVLEGIELSSGQIASLRATLGSELTRLTLEGNDFSTVQGQHLRRLPMANTEITSRDLTGEQLGRQLANSIIGGVHR